MRDNFRPNTARALDTTPAVAFSLLLACGAAFGQKAPKAGARPAPAKTTAAPGARAQAGARYSCPMHPGVKSEAPGKCPKCGMALRLAAKGAKAAASAPAAAAATRDDSRPPSIPDLELSDQDGKKVRFYTDLVRGKTVAVNFIFTTCTTICPPLGATFARVQKELGERAGRDVHFISVSVDPVTDTPERLKAWGAKFRAGPSWTFVTGDKASIDQLLAALAAASVRPEDHTPTVVVINDARGVAARTYGLASPSKLVKIIEAVAAGTAPPQE